MAAAPKKYIPLGIDDFEKLIEGNYYFVDKSLFIKELLASRAEVTLIPRPRRFGKTLNLSMTQCFFEVTGKSRRHLFTGLAIEREADCMEHQGKYPVISISFKDIKSLTWEDCQKKLWEYIGAECKRHLDVLEPVLDPFERKKLQALITGTAHLTSYESALLFLSRLLERAYQHKLIILIDEYDSPIHAGYANGYYNEIASFMRNFLGAGLKGNKCLSFGVLTGILRIAKESIFSGLNNLRVCTLTSDFYADAFGFVERDIEEMLRYFEFSYKHVEIRRWYNGYQAGAHKVYNPWSIINLLDQNGKIQAYWINTSDNALIKELLKASTPEMKMELEILMAGGSITQEVQENIILPDVHKSDAALWNFLLFCGYLTFENYHQEGRTWVAQLKIPNEEVAVSYETTFKNWFSEPENRDYTNILESITTGNAEKFQDCFPKLTRTTLSTFDVRGDEPENFYHALVLGMLASLSKTHVVRSNRESGYGRYDVMLIPKDRAKMGIIIEFKRASKRTNESLEAAAQKALTQIEEKKYETELRALGITAIMKIGIAFAGKESLVLIA